MVESLKDAFKTDKKDNLKSEKLKNKSSSSTGGEKSAYHLAMETLIR